MWTYITGLITFMAVQRLDAVNAANNGGRYVLPALNPPPVVNTPIGKVIGSSSDPRFGNARKDLSGSVTIESFLGLQYATVPRRFGRSKIPVENANQVIYATDFGPYCWQNPTNDNGDDIPYYNDQDQDEECLYLNIWRPKGTTPSSKLAVMVYIHGGGWDSMGGADPPLWGHHIVAADPNVMVITINYRLGIFGFLATDEFGTNGMNGIDDQVKALSWIKNYIKYFGGDSNRITIFGQEVGSASVCYLSVTPSANGLFQRGIMQSGECVVGDDRPDSIGLVSGKVGYSITLDVLKDTGATSVKQLAKRNIFAPWDIAGVLPVIVPVLDPRILPDFPS